MRAGCNQHGRPVIGKRRRWLPRDASDVVHWVPADGRITIVTGVSRADDLSGHGTNQLQAITTKQPALTLAVLNGRPGIVADGVDDFMSAVFTLGGTKTIFVVAKWNTAFAANSSLLDGPQGNAARLFRTAATTETMYSGSSVAVTGATPTAFHYHTLCFNGASSFYRQDGIQLGSGDVGSATAGGITLFSFGTASGDFSNATICEVIAAAGAMNLVRIQRFESYLKMKWNL